MRLRSYISASLLSIYLFSMVGAVWMALMCSCNVEAKCHSHGDQIEACAHHCGAHHHHNNQSDEDCFDQRCCTYDHSTEVALYLPVNETKGIFTDILYYDYQPNFQFTYSLPQEIKDNICYLYLLVPIERIYGEAALRAPPTLA